MGDEGPGDGAAPRADPAPSKRRRVFRALALLCLATVVVLGVLVVRDLRRRGLPTPEFTSLPTSPDTSLQGTVAFISEAKSPQVQQRQACARVVLASGAGARDVYCWAIDEPAQATAVWTDDGRLLVTSFRIPPGDAPIEPEWAKTVDVATGAAEDVREVDLGDGAQPSPGPVESPEGERVSMQSDSGEATITLSGPSGSVTLLEVSDANPDWSLQSGPVWSPDFAWVMTWDGRLLLTTTTGTPTTRILAEEASASPYGYGTPNFSVRADDVDLG